MVPRLPWALPGPARLVGNAAEDLVEGRQLILSGARGLVGLQYALEEALDAFQVALRSVDAPLHDPGVLVRTEDRPGAYWVEPGDPALERQWAEAATSLAEANRGRSRSDRVLLVLAVGPHPVLGRGLDVVARPAEVLGHADLQVAAHYLRAGQAESPAAAMRRHLAVHLAARSLPGNAALEALRVWLDASAEALADPARLIEHGRRAGLQPSSPQEARMAIWRAQVTVLLPKLDEQRTTLLHGGTERWVLPHHVEDASGAPLRSIANLDDLELAHMAAQLRQRGVPERHPLRARVSSLLLARNELCHHRPLAAHNLKNLLQLLASETT